jgi:nucleoside-triphosphatase THEP1
LLAAAPERERLDRRQAALIFKYYTYRNSPQGITFGVDAIERGKNTDVLFVDEVGPLELSDGGFVKALELVRSGRLRNSVLIIREVLLAVFLAELKTQASIFETILKNRDDLP